MKRFTIAMLALIFAMGMPMFAAAMDHSSHGKEMASDMKTDSQSMGMDHAKEMSHDMHNGQAMAAQNDDFVEIGKDTQQGVVAVVKVKTYDAETLATMAKMDMNATHHVMVFFTDEKSGKDIAGGQVALKVKGSEAKPVMMMQMGAGFGVDVSLQAGMSTFEIGTKLGDGEKRQFSVMFHNM